MGACPRSNRMFSAAAVMQPVIGSLLVRAVEKRGKARAEIVKMLQGFGCEQVGFMDNFDDCSCCWRSRIARACDRPCKVPPHPSDCRTKHLTTLQNSVVAVKIGR